jgi:hypothetical protein
MNNKLEVFNRAKIMLEMIEDRNNRELISKQTARTDIRMISKCWEIAECTPERRDKCRNYNSKTSCWLLINKCTCPNQQLKSCETCHIYQWHMRELKFVKIKRTRKNMIKSALFLEQLEPVFARFITGGNVSGYKPDRRKRMLKLIALQALESLDLFKYVSMEKYLNRIYEKLFW